MNMLEVALCVGAFWVNAPLALVCAVHEENEKAVFHGLIALAAFLVLVVAAVD